MAPSPPRRPLVSSPSSSSRRSLPPTPPLPDRLLPSPFSRPSPPNPQAVSLPPPPHSPSPRGVLRGSFGRGGVGDRAPSLPRAVRPQRRRVRRRCRGGTHEERRRGRPSSWLDLVSPCAAVAATSSPLSWPPHPPPKKSPTAGFIGDGDDAQ
uniref:Uncharacterized protein n=1 Tax=Oryza glumipatula TaxID=40148 RepID=A0A0E0ATC3_9ORYZ